MSGFEASEHQATSAAGTEVSTADTDVADDVDGNDGNDGNHGNDGNIAAADLGWFASTSAGRAVLSVLVFALSATLVVWNLPDSEVRSELRPLVRPAVNAVAIDQSWSVFAPNPTTVSLAVEADVHFRDGTVERYTFPHGDPVIGAYREYRWRKWERRVRLDRNDHLWQPTAQWIADHYPEGSVAEVVLIRRFSDTPEPGSGDTREWDAVEFYTLVVDETDSDPEDAQ